MFDSQPGGRLLSNFLLYSLLPPDTCLDPKAGLQQKTSDFIYIRNYDNLVNATFSSQEKK
jgi:hypothetical protein